MSKSNLYDKFSITNNVYKIYHIEQKNKTEKQKTFNTKKQDFLTIDHKNKLLWCMYFILKDNFEIHNENNNFKIEYDFKMKMIEKIENNPDLLKTIKVKKHDIQHDLFHSKEIDIFSLQALCIYNNISLMYVVDKKYYILGNNEPKHIIVKENYETGIYLDASPIKISYYTNNFYRVENIKKPIKSISGYTYDEIKNICIQINIQTMSGGKKVTKKELYEELIKIIS